MGDNNVHETSRLRTHARKTEREDRILDATAALILRYGYNKMTVDDIAAKAGVAKGTIYLHWDTKEKLVGALLKREKQELANDVRQRLVADPATGTLTGLLKVTALALMHRPFLKAILFQDMEVLGKLAQREHANDAYLENLASFTTYLEFLRENGLVRTDLSLQTEVYMMSAIFMGFFVVSPLMPPEFARSDEELAEMIAETVHCTLESNRPSGDDENSGSRRFQ
ncbi:MAG: TetR/AcrR family transcriptional regulator [Methanomicrobiales archaeon]|nr:TetR/AcrR family transcriptional regulator [Methanomicrobiales archaeon]